MKPETFLSRHSLFSREELALALLARGRAAATVHSHLARWLRQGRIARVKRGARAQQLAREHNISHLAVQNWTLASRLGCEVGYTTKDGAFSLETVGCLGSCAQAPVMMIGDKYYARVTVDKVSKILKLYQK